MGYQGATSARAKQTRRYPLRKVVDEAADKEIKIGDSTYHVTSVELECGHLVRPPEDIIGRRYPQRMRCRKCWLEQQGEAATDDEGT